VHVGHFALGVVDPEAFHVVDDKGRHDVYMMMVQSFAAPVTVAFYIISMVVIFSHLAHGAKSWLHTLGLLSLGSGPLVERAGPAVAWLLLAGFGSIPLAVALGLFSAT
ncbi:MAG: succinate:quinone oxidoreductase, partial [Myxococcota bacterium]